MALFIQISPKLEPILSFLFPEHSILKEGESPVGKFIIRRDIMSASEKDELATYQPDGIFISNRVFDEVWTPEVVRERCIEYSRKHLGNRKTKLEVSADSVAEDFVSFMFGTQATEEEEESINSLFDLAGSSGFAPEFIRLSETIPLAKLEKACNSFVCKVLQVNESSSVYYLKKASVLAPKIRRNLLAATDEFLERENDIYGLSVAKFYNDLFV